MIAQAPQLVQNPCCDFINAFPWWFFLLVHVALFGVGAFFAYRGFEARDRLLGWGFGLFALAEASYITYHVNITQILFAHTVSEVLDGLAFVLIFAWAARRLTAGRGMSRQAEAIR